MSNSTVIESRLERERSRRKLQQIGLNLNGENSHSNVNTITGDNGNASSMMISEDQMKMGLNVSGNNDGKSEKQMLQLEREGTEGRWLIAFFTPKRVWLLRSIAPATRRDLVYHVESLGVPRVSVVGADVAWLEVKDWMSDVIKSDASQLLENWRPNYIVLFSHGVLLRFADSKLQHLHQRLNLTQTLSLRVVDAATVIPSLKTNNGTTTTRTGTSAGASTGHSTNHRETLRSQSTRIDVPTNHMKGGKSTHLHAHTKNMRDGIRSISTNNYLGVNDVDFQKNAHTNHSNHFSQPTLSHSLSREQMECSAKVVKIKYPGASRELVMIVGLRALSLNLDTSKMEIMLGTTTAKKNKNGSMQKGTDVQD